MRGAAPVDAGLRGRAREYWWSYGGRPRTIFETNPPQPSVGSSLRSPRVLRGFVSKIRRRGRAASRRGESSTGPLDDEDQDRPRPGDDDGGGDGDEVRESAVGVHATTGWRRQRRPSIGETPHFRVG